MQPRESPSHPAPQASRFPETRWSMVLNAGEESGKQALDDLCRLYWRPLLTYCCSLGQSMADAEDLTQEFFAQFLSRGSLRFADPQRGKFRTFLLASFKNHLVSMHRRETAEKRGKGVVLQWLDEATEVSGLSGLGSAGYPPEPEQAYDRHWAEDLVARATQTLRDEQQRLGRMDWFEKVMGEHAAHNYTQVAAELNSTEEAVKSFAFRVRKRFRQLLEKEIADTVTTPEEAVEEMRYLASLLRG